jgi:hypothetical protein
MDYTTLAYALQGESEDTSMTEGLGNEIEMTKGHTDPNGIFRRLWLLINKIICSKSLNNLLMF